MAETYLEYLEETGLPGLRGTPGNRGVFVLRRVRDDRAEFLLISLWRSMDDVKAFAGADVEKAVYYPKDAEFLLEMTPNVDHYDVVRKPEGSGAKGGRTRKRGRG
jgi:heme-degrading monooxygenase HmoA